jgi:hypothetical protein
MTNENFAIDQSNMNERADGNLLVWLQCLGNWVSGDSCWLSNETTIAMPIQHFGLPWPLVTQK